MYSQNSLKALEEQIKSDFENLNIPPEHWVIEQDGRLPVAILGGGMSGLTIALALKIKGIPCQIFEQKAQGEEGPWLKPALMETLRSPKNVVGPALGSPSLTFQAWYKAQFGVEAWDKLNKIPRVQWHEYLQWFKQVTAPKFHDQHEFIDYEIIDDAVTKLVFKNHKQIKEVFASHVVFALGMETFSIPNIPHFVENISSQYWEHAYAGTDYSKFKNLDIGVVGYSAGAMDSAATALEHGAKSVELLCRCKDFPRVNHAKIAVNSGYLSAYASLTDEQKWEFQNYLLQQKMPAPHGSTLRVSKHNHAHFNFDAGITRIEQKDQKLYVYTKDECFILDYLILATGFKLNWDKTVWTQKLKTQFKIWQDVIQDKENNGLEDNPYLTPYFEFIDKSTDSSTNLYCFNFSAGMSLGPLIGMIGGVDSGATVLASQIACKIYQSQYEQQLLKIKTSTEYELEGNEWKPALSYRKRKN